MTVIRVLGSLCALASCWPVYAGLGAISEKDYLAGLLALGLAWILARTGVELVAMGRGGPSSGAGAQPNGSTGARS